MGANVSAVLVEVATKIEGSTSSVRQRVVDALVEKEVSFRAELLDKSLLKLAELKKALDKMKPDNTTYGTDGVASSSWSKKAWEEHKQSKERCDALDKAVDAALNKADDQYTAKKEDWSKLKEALEKAGKGSGGGEKKTDEQQP